MMQNFLIHGEESFFSAGKLRFNSMLSGFPFSKAPVLKFVQKSLPSSNRT